LWIPTLMFVSDNFGNQSVRANEKAEVSTHKTSSRCNFFLYEKLYYVFGPGKECQESDCNNVSLTREQILHNNNNKRSKEWKEHFVSGYFNLKSENFTSFNKHIVNSVKRWIELFLINIIFLDNILWHFCWF